MNRDQVRRTMRQQRQQLSADQKKHNAEKISEHFIHQPLFRHCRYIAAYVATDGEVDPLPLLRHAWQQHKTCYLPCLDPQKPHHLLFARYEPHARLIFNRYKIPEPALASENLIDVKTLDIILVPLVAFDDQGHRLGMGGGYYDRTFEFLRLTLTRKPILIGLAYSFQKIENIKPEIWDIPLDGVLTEKIFLRF